MTELVQRIQSAVRRCRHPMSVGVECGEPLTPRQKKYCGEHARHTLPASEQRVLQNREAAARSRARNIGRAMGIARAQYLCRLLRQDKVLPVVVVYECGHTWVLLLGPHAFVPAAPAQQTVIELATSRAELVYEAGRDDLDIGLWLVHLGTGVALRSGASGSTASRLWCAGCGEGDPVVWEGLERVWLKYACCGTAISQRAISHSSDQMGLASSGTRRYVEWARTPWFASTPVLASYGIHLRVGSAPGPHAASALVRAISVALEDLNNRAAPQGLAGASWTRLDGKDADSLIARASEGAALNDDCGSTSHAAAAVRAAVATLIRRSMSTLKKGVFDGPVS